MTRRRLIQTVGSLGGGAAAYATMQAMGLMVTPAAAYTGPPAMPTGLGQGNKVAVLGAGIAGLVAAYELSKAGYDVTVLEASGIAGGRNRTLRGGDIVVEDAGTQYVGFDPSPGLYFNAGPARLPYHHQGILSYCHELGVPLEPIVNDNRGAYFQDDEAFGGAPIRNRQLVNDTRGFVAELLSKAVNKNALDEELTALDRETFLDFLSRFGGLDDAGSYAGSNRSGYVDPPGSGLAAPGDALPPIDMVEMLRSDFWGYKLYFGEGFTQAATMMQPVGGMDRIVAALMERVAPLVKLNAEVKEIRRSGDGARIVYADARGTEQVLDADYAIVTIPFSVLSAIPNDFAPEVDAAIAACGYVKAAKAAFQSPRFWERDDMIYGGISWSSADITQIWYPTAGFGAPEGVLVGAYIWSDAIGEAFGAMSFAERLEMVKAQGARIHPKMPDLVGTGVSIAWEKVPHQRGGWASWEDAARADAYPAVTRPDGPFHFAGEHISHLTGWQEGSVLSAHDCVRAISDLTTASKL
jgi:monoamine oxidase